MAHSKSKSSTAAPPRKAAWRRELGLHPDFPLSRRKGENRWCKKVRGEVHYFTGTAQEALDEWLRVKDDLLAGRQPRSRSEGLEVGELCDRFLQAKERALHNGEIAPVTFQDYRSTTDRIVAEFGKRRLVHDLTASDFAKFRETMTKTLGFVALANAVQRVRGVFKYGIENRLITTPIEFGSEFKPPAKKLRRKVRREKVRMFEAAELRNLIKDADFQLKAMILLGINAGMGNSDIAQLPIKSLDLEAGWMDFPRPKTGVPRRVALWAETVAALKVVITKRPKPKDEADAGLAFITKYGHAWNKPGRFDGVIPGSTDEPEDGGRKKAKTIATNNALAKEFRKLARGAGITRTFYDLRHTFRTIAGGAKDLEATRAIMGHVNEHVEDAYIERIEDVRLLAVAEHVRTWLYPKLMKTGKKAMDKSKPTMGRKSRDARPAGTRRQVSALADGSPALHFRVVG